ncbi:oligosaccharide flippase family protein [Clavibacter sp. Sh2141]|uniref:oligosaccharide flippase family protein n=1 Tax=Clavibacter sp. Sh2141 TaxID=3395374 RepID=UPI0039BC3D7E
MSADDHAARGSRSRDSSVWPLGAQAVIAAVGLVAATLAARLLGPSDYGVYFLALTVTACVAVLFDICVPQAVLTHTPGYLESARTWRRMAVVVAAGAAAVTAAVALLLGSSLDADAMWVVLCAALPITMASMTPRAFLIAARQLRYVSLVDLVSVLVGNVIAIGALLVTGSLWAAASSQLVIAAVRWLAFEAAWIRRGRADLPARVPVRPAARQLYTSMYGTYQSQLAGFAARNGDNLLVSILLGPVALAQYSRAYSFLIGPLQQAQQALNPMAIRDLAVARLAGRADEQLRGLASVVIAVGVPFALAVSLSGPHLVEVLLGEEWRTAGALMPLSWGLAASMIVAIPARWALVAGHHSRALTVDAVLNYTVLAGVVVGALTGGLAGVLVINSFLVSPAITVTAWCMLGAAPRRLFLTRLLPMAVLLGGATAAACILVGALVESSLVEAVLDLTMGGLIAGVAFVVIQRRRRAA